jgi:hypothetical protein
LRSGAHYTHRCPERNLHRQADRPQGIVSLDHGLIGPQKGAGQPEERHP